MENIKLTIRKSSRHKKIAGDFGESLVLYWLSKYGFECAKVDHTGIDIIATKPGSNKRIGISVKARTRENGQQFDTVDIKSGDLKLAQQACDDFGCVPYFAIAV